jgi:hypothetical protein
MPERQAWLFLERYAGRKMAGWIRRRRATRVRRNELRDCGFRGLRWDREVALAVLAIGMAMIGLFASLI